MPATTLQDVADQAGVSKSTVSRALKNHPRISKETCERIQALVKTLKYRPDPLIATWVKRRWDRKGRGLETIAWLTAFPVKEDWKVSPFTREAFRGAEARAMERGYSLAHFWLRAPGMTAKRMSHILTSRGIRGVCIAPLPKGRSHLSLKWEDFSCATIGYSLSRPELHRASPHQLQGIEVALRALRHAGYRRIGVCIAQQVNLKVNFHWMAGVLLFQAQHGDTQIPLLLSASETNPKEFIRWFKQHRPEVLLGSNEFVKRWIDQVGLSVPVALLAWYENAALPGVDQRAADVGEAAVDLIISQLQSNETGVPRVPRVVMVQGEWRECGAAITNRKEGEPSVVSNSRRRNPA